jgi:soluble lytic murein transglycosylase-like protein
VVARWLIVVLAIVIPANAVASSNQDRDPALREKLRAAVQSSTSFSDRFEGQVWLADMSRRLARWVPDADERLEILVNAHREASLVNIPPEMVLAVIHVESGFQRYAVSRANAQGLMQIMRFWLDELGVAGHDLFDVQRNIRMGCTILRHYYDMEKGDWPRALARYNGSLGSRRFPDRVLDRLARYWYQQ